MSRDRGPDARKPEPGKEPSPRSDADIPAAGAVGADKIRAVDLKPRSNGENDWQDEVPAAKPVSGAGGKGGN